MSKLSGETISLHTDKSGKSILFGSGAVCDAKQNDTKVAAHIRHLLAADDEGRNVIEVFGNDVDSTGYQFGKVLLGASQINGMHKALEENGISKDVMSVGLVLLHESLHTVFGASFFNSKEDETDKIKGLGGKYFGDYGRYEDGGNTQYRINQFRVQIGLPQRISRQLKLKFNDGSTKDIEYIHKSPRYFD